MLGSSTSIFWNRRAKAWSFSNIPRNSVNVVEPIQRNLPELSTGFNKLDASIEPPDAAPAPMMVWISSINRIALGVFSISAKRPFNRFSKSPRYFVPANNEPISSE